MNRIHKAVARGGSLVAAWPLLTASGLGAGDPRFGVMTHFAHGWDQAQIPMVAASGVGAVRDELFWREVEPQKGVMQFSERQDRMIETLTRHKLAPLIVLSFENDHYDEGATPHSDEGIAGFARYSADVVRRYGEQIGAVEVWNEFNGSFVRGPATKDRPAAYLRLLRATHEAVKRTRAEVVVVGGGTAGVPLPYWEKLFAGGALQWMDALSVHPYRYDSPPEGIETDIAELSALVKKYNDGRPKPIWVTEIGWNARPAQGPGDIAIDDEVQAHYLVRAYALLLSAHVERVYWYLFRDYNDLRMGLARGDASVTQKRAFAAMRTMTAELKNACFIARDQTPADMYSIRFRRSGGEDVRVMWSLSPRELNVTGVTRAVDLDGRALEGSEILRLSESPIFVTGELQGLPGPNSRTLAEARQGFSERQGDSGWSYGFATATANFTALPSHSSDDWRRAWWGEQPYLSVTSTEQHPSARDGQPVAAVRRWRSERHDVVRIKGNFSGGRSGGDGVGVSVAVNGQQRFRKILGGGAGNPVGENFDFLETVEPGTTIDFVVDPGPAANPDHDNTAVNVTISTPPS
jgi:hypothetical protein